MNTELTHIFKQINDNLVRIADALEDANLIKREEARIEKFKAVKESKNQRLQGSRGLKKS